MRGSRRFDRESTGDYENTPLLQRSVTKTNSDRRVETGTKYAGSAVGVELVLGRFQPAGDK